MFRGLILNQHRTRVKKKILILNLINIKSISTKISLVPYRFPSLYYILNVRNIKSSNPKISLVPYRFQSRYL